MRIWLIILMFFPFIAMACSFKNETYPVTTLVIAFILTVSSLLLFFKCLPEKKKIIKTLIFIIQLIPIIFVFLNWDLFYCSSNFDTYSTFTLFASVLLLISALLCKSWRFIKTRNRRKNKDQS